MIISMIVLLLVLARGGFTIPILAIVLIMGTAPGTRIMTILSLFVAVVHNLSVHWGED